METQRIHMNCLKIQFGAQSRMPIDKEIFAFLRKRLWLPEMLQAMFREPRDYSVYVKFKTEELLTTELLKCPSTDDFFYENGDTVQVTFATAKGNFKYVRLFGIPIELDDSHVINVITKYGKVHKFVREKYGVDTGYPILNGVRGVYLEVNKSIPAQIYVQNYQTRVSYEGMERKCFSCGNVDHIKQDCPNRIQVNDRLISSKYSAVLLSNGNSIKNQAKLSITSHEKNVKPSEFPPLKDSTQMSKASSQVCPIKKPQMSTGKPESSTKEQLRSVVMNPMPNVQGMSSVANVETKTMEVVDQRDLARKREHAEEDSDTASGTSGSVECPQQPETGLISFKVPGVNDLLEKQVKATKFRTKTRKSKKLIR